MRLVRRRIGGSSGNKKLHGWEFGRFTRLLEYKAEEVGILVSRESERDTSKSCCECGACDGSNRVERGLYVCSECSMTANADVNGAENIRQKITQNPRCGDMSNGRLARPQVCVFDMTAGLFKSKSAV
jgi:putative transposase